MERSIRLDGVKFFLIVLVVIGHCIEPSRYNNAISGGAYSIIYSFHMPLFVFLSGYFAKVNSWADLRKKSFRFLETFLVIMIPQFLVFRSWHGFLNPENSGWYLMSLIWWYLILLIVKKIDVKMSVLGGVLISIFISFLVFNLPLGPYGRLLSFNRTMQMLPFFSAGYLLKMKGGSLPHYVSKKTMLLIIVLAVIALGFLLYYSNRTLHVLEFYNVDVWTISNVYHISVGVLLVCRSLLMLAAVILSFVIVENLKMPAAVSSLGSSTLVVYVLQGVLAHVIPSFITNSFIYQLGIAGIVILLSVVLIKTIDCRYITNPVSTLYNRIKIIKNENNK